MITKELLKVYPFNLAKDIFGSDEAAFEIYVLNLPVVLSTLETREQDVVVRRYRDGMTYKDIGNIHGVCGSRSKQILSKSIRKLRHPSRSDLLRGVPIADITSRDAKYAELLQAHTLILETLRPPEPEQEIPVSPDILQLPIASLNLSFRAYNWLTRANKETVADIMHMTEPELLSIRNIGKKSADEILTAISVCLSHNSCIT